MAGTKKRARCLFCAVEGVTKEHILAKSLTELFSGHGVIRHAYEHPELGVEPRIKRAKSLAYVARKFCASCNNGWNDLDQRVRPLLEAFAKDRPLALEEDDQVALALWTTKTLLAFLSIEPDEYRFAPPWLYHDLYRTRAPLAGTQVWVGANEHGHIGWQRAHSLTFQDLPEQKEGFGASMSFGYGVLHFIFHGSDDLALHLRNAPLRALRPIWPTTKAFVWPPDLRLRPHDLTPLPLLINANSRFVSHRRVAAE